MIELQDNLELVLHFLENTKPEELTPTERELLIAIEVELNRFIKLTPMKNEWVCTARKLAGGDCLANPLRGSTPNFMPKEYVLTLEAGGGRTVKVVSIPYWNEYGCREDLIRTLRPPFRVIYDEETEKIEVIL